MPAAVALAASLRIVSLWAMPAMTLLPVVLLSSPWLVISRAALVRHSGSLALFISGTASIVGHRSTHVGDIAAQTRETLVNIEALLGQANAAASGTHFDLGSLAGKVYVRRPADLPIIQAQLAPALAAGAHFVYLQADICRQDLSVEIEAAAIRPFGTGATPDAHR